MICLIVVVFSGLMFERSYQLWNKHGGLRLSAQKIRFERLGSSWVRAFASTMFCSMARRNLMMSLFTMGYK